jgi:hypothetical protein
MAQDLTEKIETMLGEFRIMVPALGALIGFQLVVAFQASFRELPPHVQAANFAGVACTLLALLFLLVPASTHHFSDRLDTSRRFLRLAQRSIGAAFLFLPAGLALSLYVQAMRTFESEAEAAVFAAGLLAALAIGWWLVPWLYVRGRRGGQDK